MACSQQKKSSGEITTNGSSGRATAFVLAILPTGYPLGRAPTSSTALVKMALVPR